MFNFTKDARRRVVVYHTNTQFRKPFLSPRTLPELATRFCGRATPPTAWAPLLLPFVPATAAGAAATVPGLKVPAAALPRPDCAGAEAVALGPARLPAA